MQTFLPYPDFVKSAECLDYRRLGKQRVEAKQILNALERGEGGWYNHPATKMWEGYEVALKQYHDVMITEWKHRGYNNNMPLYGVTTMIFPTWFGNDSFHASHRSNLLRKDPVWYGQFSWEEPDHLEYIWPTQNRGVLTA